MDWAGGARVGSLNYGVFDSRSLLPGGLMCLTREGFLSSSIMAHCLVEWPMASILVGSNYFCQP